MSLDVPTVSGGSLRETAVNAKITRDEVLHPLSAPLAVEGGLAVLRGNLAPLGAVVKQSGIVPGMMRHTGPAHVFECEEELQEKLSTDCIMPGDVLVDPQ